MRKIIFNELQNQTRKELFNKYDIDKSVKIPLEFNKIYQTSYNYCTLYHKFVSFKKCITGKSLSQINIRKRKNVNDTSIELSLKKFKQNNIHQNDSDSVSENLDDQSLRNFKVNIDCENDNNNNDLETNFIALNKKPANVVVLFTRELLINCVL